jgi:hypothetical protein
MSTISFTKEHKEKLNALALEALFQGTEFKAKIGANHTIHDLLHTCSLNTLQQLHSQTKKEAAEIETMDEWSLTDHQQRKLKDLKDKQEILNLLIGYKRYLAEAESKRQELKELKGQLKNLQELNKTPDQRQKELEAKIASLETA